MNKYVSRILGQASPESVNFALLFMRVGLGILSIGHGYPKLIGGPASWQSVGSALGYLGIHFLPVMWGLIGACTEFFGGIALILGLSTRFASLLLTLMMIVAFVMHFKTGDPFQVYSFSLSLAVVFIGFLITGSGKYSLDSYLSGQG